ncbi:MAG: RNA-binding protein [Dehalococcoidales bacterium]|nr:MAG: RNA-binding protein [Dehalococcoidales bacterium]
MRIYVGNLSYEVTEQSLREEFEAYGGVDSINVITDKYSGRPKGFAFIEMASKSESEAAITGLNGKALNERTIVVNEARPRIDNRSGGSYSGGYGSRGDRPGRGRQQRRY